MIIWDKPKEKCAVFGIHNHKDAAYLVYLGLWALQHRGQESSGISSTNRGTILTHKKNGLVSDIFPKEVLLELKGNSAIGHNRYSTSGGSKIDHSQPVTDSDNILALAHNGNLPITDKLEKFLRKEGRIVKGRNDSELMFDAIKTNMLKGISLEDSVISVYSMFTGAFSLLLMTKNKIVALRDEYGIRPLSIGSLDGSFVFSSETCGFDIIGAKFIRDVAPGEMVVIDDKGLHSYQIKKGVQKLDIFEMIYFARPDSYLLGKSVNTIRMNLGKELAREYLIKADIVIPVPDSAIPMALGYSNESKIPFEHGLTKNRYIHRTFIEPTKDLRTEKVKIKFNPLREVIKGKDIIVIDDSIVRGTTSKALVALLKSAGANKVHLLSASPPIKYPDYYGIDIPSKIDLISANMTEDKIKEYVGADSLHFLSYKGLIRATDLDESMFCTSCLTGIYPIDIGNKSEDFKTRVRIKTLRKTI